MSGVDVRMMHGLFRHLGGLEVPCGSGKDVTLNEEGDEQLDCANASSSVIAAPLVGFLLFLLFVLFSFTRSLPLPSSSSASLTVASLTRA